MHMTADSAIDNASLVHDICRCFREKQLAEIVNLLSDDFKLRVLLPTDTDDEIRPRSRAEVALLAHASMGEFDILRFEPHDIALNGDMISSVAHVKFRHKKTGKELETQFQHAWRAADGKICALEQTHDLKVLSDYADSIEAVAREQSQQGQVGSAPRTASGRA
ncbi:nuclear transport factor 2 family protein [Hyphomicrobium sp. D-2]|uniref:nuclear transport factor 2 family protein n=1 Tax=Hyphomicrobium sp. D-2 TaxID=3041621 RepID=UPI002453D949|nr:nuclear transport factor 2 family protein [Hyphomicrobium sp. D-2]MDH4982070.1 nuclear transport factor 2 family protein [Hyphomicrobium sp. D-2]